MTCGEIHKKNKVKDGQSYAHTDSSLAYINFLKVNVFKKSFLQEISRNLPCIFFYSLCKSAKHEQALLGTFATALKK
jgi:hypothetical protein